MRASIVTLAMWCAALALVGCDDREDFDGSRRRPPGLPERVVEASRDLGDRRVAYDLFDARPQLSGHSEGSLVVEAGTVDLVKYTDGGTTSSWLRGRGGDVDGAALVDGLGGQIYVPLEAPTGDSLRVAWRARAAVRDQLVSVFLNEHKLGDIAMPTTAWHSYEVEAPAAYVVDGENELRFYFRAAGDLGGARSAAAFRRFVFGGVAAASKPAFAAGQVTLGDTRQAALSTQGPARLSLYTILPADAPGLAFSLAGGGAARVIVTADGKRHELWKGEASAGFVEQRVDLSAFAGRAVRLDLDSDDAVHWGRPQITAAAAPPRDVAETSYDHIIVWSVASLRADRVLGESAAARDYLRARGLRLRARAPAPESARAHAAIMTGRRDAGDRIADAAVTVAERLGRAGYATQLVSGNAAVGKDRGFTQGFARHERGASAAALWKDAASFIAERAGARTFSYIATADPYLPYTCPDTVVWNGEPVGLRATQTASISDKVRAGRWSLTGVEKRFVTALYDGCVAANAAAFAAMLEGLGELGVADRTAVVLVGDHGEELWERGGFGRGRELFDEGVLVPVVIAAPGLPSVELDLGAELVDVGATLLELAGVAPDPSLQGEGLLAMARQAPPVPEPVLLEAPGQARALVWGRYKLIVPVTGPVVLYDLAADPGETRNAATDAPIATRALRNVLAIAVAFEGAWSAARWGSPHRLAPAFAADQGR